MLESRAGSVLLRVRFSSGPAPRRGPGSRNAFSALRTCRPLGMWGAGPIIAIVGGGNPPASRPPERSRIRGTWSVVYDVDSDPRRRPDALGLQISRGGGGGGAIGPGGQGAELWRRADRQWAQDDPGLPSGHRLATVNLDGRRSEACPTTPTSSTGPTIPRPRQTGLQSRPPCAPADVHAASYPPTYFVHTTSGRTRPI